MFTGSPKSNEELASQFLDVVRLFSSSSRAERLRAHSRISVLLEADERASGPGALEFLDVVVKKAAEWEMLDDVGSSLMEDVIVWRPDLWAEISDRCGSEPAWREAVTSAWVEEPIAKKLPATLRECITVA